MKRKSFKQWWQSLAVYKPLGWSQLTHQKARMAVALTGVAFSNILIFTQLGLRALLFDGVTLLPENLKGDLFLASAFAPSIDWNGFPRIYLYQASAVEGVASASPLYISSANWVNPEDLEQPATRPDTGFELFPNRVKILAFNPSQPVLNLPEVNRQLPQLTAPDSILFDRLAQDKLGPVVDLYAQEGSVVSVMNRQRVYVTGLFNFGSNLFDNGHVIMSDWNFARRQGEQRLQQINVGCIQVEPGVDLTVVQQRLREHLPADIRVMTREELMTAEQSFQASFPNGKILNFGAIMGFIVGVVIVYQVLYTDVSDHLPEYATLKAMGYSDRALLAVVVQEALILGILGFIPGLFSSWWIYGILTQLTKIPLTMRLAVVIQVFCLTVLMCLVSGAIAMNKLRSADPADVF